jgi:hypothetical protein
MLNAVQEGPTLKVTLDLERCDVGMVDVQWWHEV